VVLSHAPATVGEGGAVVGRGRVVVFDPEGWVGKPFPLLKHVDVGAELAGGRWAVLFYRADCPACREKVAEFEARARAAGRGPGPRLALIDIHPHTPGREAGAAKRPCLRGSLGGDREWFMRTPAVVELADGRVTAVRPGP
jgi:hypothetical protein